MRIKLEKNVPAKYLNNIWRTIEMLHMKLLINHLWSWPNSQVIVNANGGRNIEMPMRNDICLLFYYQRKVILNDY